MEKRSDGKEKRKKFIRILILVPFFISLEGINPKQLNRYLFPAHTKN